MITGKHLDQMRHAVGFFSDSPGYRNGFSTQEDDPIWTELKEIGFADGRSLFGAYSFWVTDKGKDLIGLDDQKSFVESKKRDHDRDIEQLCEDHEIEIG